MTAAITDQASMPELADPIDIPDDWASMAAFAHLLARQDLNRQEKVDVIDVGIRLIAPRMGDSDRGGKWETLTGAIRAGNPDELEGALRELLGTPVAITIEGEDATGRPVNGELEVSDPVSWIRRRHRQGWQELSVTRDGVEVGGIIRCGDTGNCGVWIAGGQPACVDGPGAGDQAGGETP